MKTYKTLFVSALLLAAAPASNAQGRFQVGEPFPNISFPSLEDGKAASIADYRGQKVLLHIFASW